jgi:hypothetical protein
MENTFTQPNDDLARKPYVYQEWPRVLYNHSTGKTIVVSSAAQMAELAKKGYRKDPPPPERDEDAEALAAAAKADEEAELEALTSPVVPTPVVAAKK